MSDYVPSLSTTRILEGLVDSLLNELPTLLGVDEFISNCEVVHMDPAGVGVFPRYVRVRIHEYQQDVYYRGGLGIGVGDYVTVLHYRQGDRYEIFGSGGSAGVFTVELEALADYSRGYMIRGGLYDWEAFWAGEDGSILVGDGTDINSVDAHGDVDVASDGEVTVIGLQGRDLSAAAPNNLDVVTWNNGLSQWEPQAAPGGTIYPPHFTKGDILLNLTFDHLFTMFDIEGESDTNYWLTSRRDRIWNIPGGTNHSSRGSVRLEPSLWPFRKAFGCDLDGINLVTNPSFEVDTTGWASVATGGLTRTRKYSYWQVWALEYTATAQFGRAQYSVIPGAGTYSASIYVRSDSASTYFQVSGSVSGILGSMFHPGDGQWHRLFVHNVTIVAGETITIMVPDARAAGWTAIQIDGAQLINSTRNLPYMDGDREDGHAWTAVNHASTTERDHNYLRLDEFCPTLSDRNEHSIRVVVQMPYDADYDQWPNATYNMIWDVRGASNNDRLFLAYNATTDKFEVYINGAIRLQSALQTFDAGEWFDIICTFDFTADYYQLMINGVLEDTDSTVLTTPTGLYQWAVGSRYDGSIDRMSGFVYAEHTVYDHELSITDHRALYLTGPTIDPESQLPDRNYPYTGWQILCVKSEQGFVSDEWQEVPTGSGFRFQLAGRWGSGHWYLEANVNHVGLGQTEVKLQFYDPYTAAWRDVPGSLITYNGVVWDRLISIPMSIPQWQAEYRVVMRQSISDQGTAYIGFARVYCDHGMDPGL